MTSQVKVTYFDTTGLAEPIRLILSYGGIKFQDVRISHDDWQDLKTKLPWPQLPVVEMDGKLFFQSKAICRLLAKRFDLCGKTEWEETLADIMVDTLYDFRTKVDNLLHIQNLEERDKAYKTVTNEIIPSYLERFEKHILYNGGFFVAGKITWADIIFFAFSENVTQIIGKDLIVDYPKLKCLQKKVLNLPGIKEWCFLHQKNRKRNSVC